MSRLCGHIKIQEHGFQKHTAKLFYVGLWFIVIQLWVNHFDTLGCIVNQNKDTLDQWCMTWQGTVVVLLGSWAFLHSIFLGLIHESLSHCSLDCVLGFFVLVLHTKTILGTAQIVFVFLIIVCSNPVLVYSQSQFALPNLIWIHPNWGCGWGGEWVRGWVLQATQIWGTPRCLL